MCPNYFLGTPRPSLLPNTWKIQFTRGVLVYISVSTLEPSHISRRSRSPDLSQTIGVCTRGHSEDPPERHLDPDYHPVDVKMAKIDFWGRFGAKMVPKWALRAAGWDPQKI